MLIIDPILGSNQETNNETTFSAIQQILRCKKRWLLLRNSLVNTLLWQQLCMQQRTAENNSIEKKYIFLVISLKRLGAKAN
jgi:hypothetical protein